MVADPIQRGPNPSGENLPAENLDSQLNSLQEKIETLAETKEKNKVFEMATKMSSKVLEMALSLPEGDPDREEAMDAIAEMVDASLELKNADNTVAASNDTLVS